MPVALLVGFLSSPALYSITVKLLLAKPAKPNTANPNTANPNAASISLETKPQEWKQSAHQNNKNCDIQGLKQRHKEVLEYITKLSKALDPELNRALQTELIQPLEAMYQALIKNRESWQQTQQGFVGFVSGYWYDLLVNMAESRHKTVFDTLIEVYYTYAQHLMVIAAKSDPIEIQKATEALLTTLKEMPKADRAVEATLEKATNDLGPQVKAWAIDALTSHINDLRTEVFEVKKDNEQTRAQVARMMQFLENRENPFGGILQMPNPPSDTSSSSSQEEQKYEGPSTPSSVAGSVAGSYCTLETDTEDGFNNYDPPLRRP